MKSKDQLIDDLLTLAFAEDVGDGDHTTLSTIPADEMGRQHLLVKEEGIQKVLETAAKMGYKNLETASYDNGKIYGLAPAEFKKMVNDLGMKCTSAHLGQAFTKEKEVFYYYVHY